VSNKNPTYRLVGLVFAINAGVYYICRKHPNFSTVHLHSADFYVKPKISWLAGRKFAKPQPAENFWFTKINKPLAYQLPV